MRHFHFPHIKGYTLCAAALIGMLPTMNSYSASSTDLLLTPTVMTLKQDGSAPVLNHPAAPMNRSQLVPNNVTPNAQGDRLLTVPEPTQPSSKDGTATTSTPKKPHYKDGEVLVLFKKGVTKTVANSALGAKAATVVKGFDQLTARTGQVFALVRGGKGVSSAQLMKSLSKDYRVQATSLNYGKRPSVISDTSPNDPGFGYQWSLNNSGQTGGTSGADIQAIDAWDQHTNSENVVIAVIDTGVDYRHPDLKNNMWINPGEIAGDGVDNDKNGYTDDIYGIDTGTGDSDPYPTAAHGTHVAGIIAAEGNNGKGVTGINWRGRIMAVQGFSPDGYMYDDAELAALQYILTMKNKGTNIVAVNASYGCAGCYNDVMEAAIKNLGDVGIVFVAAAGNEENDNDSDPTYPAGYDLPNVISVAATDDTDSLAWYSNYGATSVDLGAPGSSILSTYWSTTYTPKEGDVFFDNVESGANGWEFDLPAPWAITATTETNHAWTDSPNGDYANSQSTALISRPINLVGKTGLSFGFNAKYDLESDYDFLDVYYVIPSVWKITTEQKRTGTKAWSDSLSGNYFNNTYSGIISPEINLSDAASGTASISFYLKGAVEPDYDMLGVYCGSSEYGIYHYVGYVSAVLKDWTQITASLPDDCLVDKAQISFVLWSDEMITYDGYYLDDISVAVNGTTVFSDSMEGTNHWLTFGERYQYVGGLTGSSDGEWINYNISLSDPALYAANFRVALVLNTDGSVVDDGVYLDDIGIGQEIPTHNYAWMSGTSMATPHVTGAVGFLASLYKEPMENRINRILNNTDSIPALRGKTAHGRLNLGKAVNSIGLTASTICIGNFDNDGDIDDSDKTVFGNTFGMHSGQECYDSADSLLLGKGCYDSRADFDHDGDVDGTDLVTFRADYGRTNCLAR
jgi:subtilisin family serine protease